MKFLVDENVPHLVVTFLRSKKHLVIDVKNSHLRQADDKSIIATAIKSCTVVITFDKDFLQLYHSDPNFLAILFRTKPSSKQMIIKYMKAIIASYSAILSDPPCLIIVEKDEIKIF